MTDIHDYTSLIDTLLKIANGYETANGDMVAAISFRRAAEALTSQASTIAELEKRLKEATEWRPIETAPTDGTQILICNGTYRYDASDYSQDEPFNGVTIAYWKYPGWCGGYGEEYDGEYWHKPTHWLPLPSSPLKEGE